VLWNWSLATQMNTGPCSAPSEPDSDTFKTASSDGGGNEIGAEGNGDGLLPDFDDMLEPSHESAQPPELGANEFTNPIGLERENSGKAIM